MNAAITKATVNAIQIAPPVSPPNLADERVDPAAQDVADDEEEKKLRPDRAAKSALLLLGRINRLYAFGRLHESRSYPRWGSSHVHACSQL